jgi:hypothetical protein
MPIVRSALRELRERGWHGFYQRLQSRIHHHYISLTEEIYFRYWLPGQFRLHRALSPDSIGPDYLHNSESLQALHSLVNTDDKEAILSACDRLLEFDFSDFSAAYLHDDSPGINWHTDYLTGRIWPLVSGHRLDYSSDDRPGDIRVMWEMHRHLFFMFLGVGYLLSGDERYAEFFKLHFFDWVERNPIGRGLAWIGPQIQENGIRNISWIWGSLLFADSPLFSSHDWNRLHQLIFIQGGFINRYLNSNKEISHNHLISEAGGLFLTGLFFRKHCQGKRWLRKARKAFTEALQFQVHPDGVQGEFSAHYHAFVLETALQVLLFGREAGIVFPEAFVGRIEGMLRHVVDITNPDGTLPQFGDTDNATSFAFSVGRVENRSRYRSLAATLFADESFLRSGDRLQVETLLLLGTGAAAVFTGLSVPADEKCHRDSYYPSSNILTREHHTQSWQDKLIYRGGGALFPYRMGTGHNHADQGGFEYWRNGETIYSDGGTWAYSFDDSWRFFFRSAQAHNTVTVDDRDSLPIRANRFGIPRMTPTETVQLVQEVEFARISTRCEVSEHPGWIQTRIVSHFHTGVMIIEDLVDCPGQHRLGQHFNLNGRVTVSGGFPRRVTIDTGHQQLYQMWLTPVSIRHTCGEELPPSGWHSPRYGFKVPREHLLAELAFNDHGSLTTIIAPTEIEISNADIVINQIRYRALSGHSGWQIQGTV